MVKDMTNHLHFLEQEKLARDAEWIASKTDHDEETREMEVVKKSLESTKERWEEFTNKRNFNEHHGDAGTASREDPRAKAARQDPCPMTGWIDYSGSDKGSSGWHTQGPHQ